MTLSHESHWLVMRRCLAIVRRLQSGPASQKDLIKAVYAQEGQEAYGQVESKTLSKKFHKDLARIREYLDAEVHYDWNHRHYVLHAPGKVALLNLPDEALKAIAFLSETFDQQAPKHEKISLLLGTLTNLLSDDRRRDLMRQRNLLQVNLNPKDSDDISFQVQETLERACIERRRVEFLYGSPAQQDQQPRRHEVEPYELIFDTTRRHYYLRGFCLYTDGPLGKHRQERYFRYRLGRIFPESVQILPQKISLIPRRTPKYIVRYALVPEIARFGVTQHFEDTVVESRDDGSAVVQGYADDIFWATRTLLHYGPGCRVLGGSEVLHEMRRLVKQMGEVYEISF